MSISKSLEILGKAGGDEASRPTQSRPMRMTSEQWTPSLFSYGRSPGSGDVLNELRAAIGGVPETDLSGL